MQEYEDIDEAECDEVVKQEPNVSITVSGVRRLLDEKEHYYESKVGNMFWKKEPPAVRASEPVHQQQHPTGRTCSSISTESGSYFP